MFTAFSFIGTSWGFCRKQPVLLQVALWLIALPLIGMNVLGMILSDTTDPTIILPGLLGILVLSVLLVCGTACILLIGSKLLGAKSGRNRTSLRAVAREARTFIIPLILTGILRGIITCLWGLLLIVPGIIYAIRTVLYSVIIIEEGTAYRPSLQQSKAIVKGRLGFTFVTLLVLLITLFVPISLIDTLLALTVQEGSSAFFGIAILDGLLTALGVTLFTLSTILLYGTLRPAAGPVTGGGKK